MDKRNLRAKLTMAPGSEAVHISIIRDVSTISMAGYVSFNESLKFLKEWRKLKEDDEFNSKLWKLAAKYGLSAPMR